ncbi:MAG: hypothetical protein KME23_07770 [Goleter apudmare HA4340-LM2]|nr:hypothetical protein [Goleter apudmare HA4340-LM2]
MSRKRARSLQKKIYTFGMLPNCLQHFSLATPVGSAPAYGNDEWTQKAADYFREV